MSNLPQIPQRFDQAVPLLRPRPMGFVPREARRRELAALVGRNGVDLSSSFEVTVPGVGDVEYACYLSYPEANVPVSAGECQRWGTTPSELISRALEVAATAPSRVDSVDGCVLANGEGIDALALANPAFATATVGGAPALMLLPAYGYAVIVPQGDAAAFENAASLALRILQDEARFAVSPSVFATDGTQWTLSAPPGDSIAYGNYVRFWWMLQYDAAKPALETIEKNAERDSIVSKYSVAESSQTRRYRSMAPLVEQPEIIDDVKTLLPYVDEVLLTLLDGKVVRRPFADLQAIPGLLEPVPNFVPGYVRVTRFPKELV